MSGQSRSRGVPRRAWLVPVPLLVLLLLATGCQAALGLQIRLAADGGGVVTLALSVDDELGEQLRAAGADPLGDLARLGATLDDEGWRVTDVTGQDGGREVSLEAPFADAEAFNRLAGDLVAALDAPEASLLEDLRLAVDEERIRLVGVAALQPGPAVEDLGLEGDDAVELLRDTDAFRYEITVFLPGEVLDTTAAEPAVVPLTWQVEPGERVTLLAEGDRPASVPWIPLVAGGVGGVGALLLVRRLNR